MNTHARMQIERAQSAVMCMEGGIHLAKACRICSLPPPHTTFIQHIGRQHDRPPERASHIHNCSHIEHRGYADLKLPKCPHNASYLNTPAPLAEIRDAFKYAALLKVDSSLKRHEQHSSRE